MELYLFASTAGNQDESSRAVFYKIDGESLATSLCSLFTKEYADEEPQWNFHSKPVASFQIEERVLMNEMLDWLSQYDDPDPGIYDPAPTQNLLDRAQFAIRATKWEELLRGQAGTKPQNELLDAKDSTDEPAVVIEGLPKLSAEDRRNSGLVLLMLLSQAYYKMLECTISMASWGAVLDIELNQSYFWTVASITNLIKNHEDLKDFPTRFEPIFPNLYPSTIRHVEWEDMVAPDAERFLSTVQQYVHSKGIYDPEEGSQAWVFIELYRPSVNTAIERAIAYHKRMQQHWQRLLGSSNSPNTTTSSTSGAQIEIHTQEDGASNKREKVFVSYSHKDKKLFGEFQTMLAPAIRRGKVDIWDDTKIVPGAKWKEEILAALRTAKIAVLLVSSNFLASEFIAKHELPPLLETAQNQGARIFWIYLSACLYEQTEIADYQAAHDTSRPLDSFSKSQRQALLSEICAKLIRLADNSD
jgi:hypothetical protein